MASSQGNVPQENRQRQRNRSILRFHDDRSRRKNFKKRMETLRRKITEITKFCNVPACLVGFGPDGKAFTLPESQNDVETFIANYEGLGTEKKNKKKVSLSSFLQAQKKKLEAKLKVKKEEEEKFKCSFETLDEWLDEQSGEYSMMNTDNFLESKLKSLDEKEESIKMEEKRKGKQKVTQVCEEKNMSPSDLYKRDNFDMLDQFNLTSVPSDLYKRENFGCSYSGMTTLDDQSGFMKSDIRDVGSSGSGNRSTAIPYGNLQANSSFGMLENFALMGGNNDDFVSENDTSFLLNNNFQWGVPHINARLWTTENFGSTWEENNNVLFNPPPLLKFSPNSMCPQQPLESQTTQFSDGVFSCQSSMLNNNFPLSAAPGGTGFGAASSFGFTVERNNNVLICPSPLHEVLPASMWPQQPLQSQTSQFSDGIFSCQGSNLNNNFPTSAAPGGTGLGTSASFGLTEERNSNALICPSPLHEVLPASMWPQNLLKLQTNQSNAGTSNSCTQGFKFNPSHGEF